jgi:hypothetical protein
MSRAGISSLWLPRGFVDVLGWDVLEWDTHNWLGWNGWDGMGHPQSWQSMGVLL